MTSDQTQSTTTPYTTSQIRQAFIDFFAKLPGHEHTFVPSSPAAPIDDPTLLFTNAGMNQFKPCFLGTVEKGSQLDGVKRAVNSQKCIRAGGKHNDLDDVGLDTYHHTFFEMLGNWSFGDFFKTEIIGWAYTFLTEVCGLSGDRIYATYFEGDKSQGLEPDTEARDLWLKFLPPERVIPGNYSDNFWEMGDVGPCGPCSELHYDRIGGRNAAELVNQDDPDVIEVWNLVFIQYNREKDGDGSVLKPLPAKHVDTGMGLERLVSIIQDKSSNYDTDVFMPIFEAIQKATGFDKPYGGKLGSDDTDRVDMAYRVIADHIRTLVVAIGDGATPSNEGRGYVMRRVLRRAVRFGRQMLGAETGFMTDLVPTVAESLKSGFPDIAKNTAKIAEIIADEEESFGRTLGRGIEIFDEFTVIALSKISSNIPTPAGKMHGKGKNRINNDWVYTEYYFDDPGGDPIYTVNKPASKVTPDWIKSHFLQIPIITGEDAFTLYDTYGFPLDLTEIMAGERGLKVDVEGFRRCMEEQRERSRAGSKFGSGGDELKLEPDMLARLAGMNAPATDTAAVFENREVRGRILAIFNGKTFEETVSTSSAGLGKVGVILDKTSFYAEAGGQVADTGRLSVVNEHRREGNPGTQSEFKVEEVKRFGDYVMHIGQITKGQLTVGEDVECRFDSTKRKQIQANHTATHLLNLGLRRELGDTVDQKGSLVEPGRLRFDFSHNKPMTDDQACKAEAHVRDQITQSLVVGTGIAPLETAKSISGLRAVFGEKYPDPVRVVSVGQSVQDLIAEPTNPAWAPMSIEFCGGTHVANTSEIEAFALISETGVAKGVRRVEAITGVPAKAAMAAAVGLNSQIDDLDKTPDSELAKALGEINSQIDQLTLSVSDRAALRSRLAKLQDRAKAAAKLAANAARETAVGEARSIAQSASADLRPFIVGTVTAGDDRGALQAALKVVQDKCPTAGALLMSVGADRVALIAWVPDAQIMQGLKAGDWIRTAAEACGGKGGGKPNQAQGGGTEPSKAKDALQAAESFAAKAIL